MRLRQSSVLGLLLFSSFASGCRHSDNAKDPHTSNLTLGDPEDPNRADDVSPGQLPFPSSPGLDNVQVQANTDSAILTLPSVPGAKDYRAFRLPAGTTLSVGPDGAETVLGTTLYCAGQQQQNAPALPTAQVLSQLQVNDVTVPTTIVVEAIDTICPFPGVFGHSHVDLQATASQLPASDLVGFSVFTEAEIRHTYGSMIFNGQGPGPTLATPAPPTAPHVLARTVLLITPQVASAPVSDFFDDFAIAAIPTLIENVSTFDRTTNGQLFQTPTWTFYSYGCDYCEIVIERGQLNMIAADYSQNVIASDIAIPRQVTHLSTTSYLHVTYQIPSNMTQRRYWWLSLCGSDQVGQTLDANGVLASQIIPAPFFDEVAGANPSIAGWNCLQVFPRDGWPFPLAPGANRPQSDVRVMLNVAPDAAGNTVKNVSPDEYDRGPGDPPSWYRQMGSDDVLVAPMLDDQLNIEMQTTFDVYIRRDRVLVYAQGQQRLCNDFPNAALTMAEAVVGFGQILFDSADEFLERLDASNLRTGQLYYSNNTPFIDSRGWHNVGFQEQVSAPDDFDPTLCYVSP